MYDETFNEANFPELMLKAIIREALEQGWINEYQIDELAEAIQFQMMEISQEEGVANE